MAADVVWVGLLRGVNIGPRNRIAMADLRALVDDLGLGPARTYIASGNVLLHAPKAGRAKLARALQEAIVDATGLDVPVVLRTAAELRAVVDNHPFGRDTSHTYVTFLDGKPTAACVARIDAKAVEPDRFVVRGSDVYLHYPNLVTGSRLTGALLERSLGVAGTARNWRTTVRLAELAASDL